jgi:hypothetical protein
MWNTLLENTLFFATLNAAQQRKFMAFAEAYGNAYKKGQGCTDPRILSLPHHKRIVQNEALAIEARFLEEFAPAVIAESKRPGTTRRAIATLMFERYPDLVRTMYKGRMEILYDIALRMMVFHQRVRFFQTTDALESMLHVTDFGHDIPAKWFHPPFDEIYIEFGEHRHFPTKMMDPSSGEHVVEGCYLFSGLSPSLHGSDLVRGFDLIIFGSPVGKCGVTNDCFIYLGLPLSDEEMPISALVDQVVDHYRTRSDFPNAHVVRPVIEHVAKVLVYLGTKEARQREVSEGTEALKRISGLKSSAKREKAARQAARLYDRIVVGPSNLPSKMDAIKAIRTTGVRPHIRRGHFRAQPYGPQHSLRRPQWIQPMLIGRDHIAGEAQPSYVIQ